VRLVLIDLRTLMSVPGVLDREWVKLELVRDEVDLFAVGIGDVQPARVRSAKLGELVRGPLDYSMFLFDE
jgi:hypothetical protein